MASAPPVSHAEQGCCDAESDELRRENSDLAAALEGARAESAARRASYLARERARMQQDDASTASSGAAATAQEHAATRPSDLCRLLPASSEPLVYVVDAFLSHAECDHLVRLGQRQVCAS